jgi:hypothetical protein
MTVIGNLGAVGLVGFFPSLREKMTGDKKWKWAETNPPNPPNRPVPRAGAGNAIGARRAERDWG